MKTITSFALVTALAALAACGNNNTANNTADLNAGVTDMNATTTDMNATTDMNSGGAMTGNTDLNAAGAGAGAGATGTTNATGNTTAGNRM
jgi:hypothetical protein